MKVIPVGSKVRIGENTEAIVIEVRISGTIQYVVAWWSGEVRTVEALEECEVKVSTKKRTTIGFHEP